jgi:outer membrane protein
MTRILVFLLVIMNYSVSAQIQKWSLEDCVEYAKTNNLSIKQAQYNIANTALGLKQNKLNRLPSVNGSVGAGNQYGRTIDPVTNSFETQQIGFNSFSISGGLTVFGGNVINNSIKQGKLNLEAAQFDASAAANDIGLNIAAAFLNILLSEELLANAEKRLELSTEQLNVIEKQINAGVLPDVAKFDVLAQVALDRQTVVDAENAVEINLLNLQQLMQLDPTPDFDIIRPTINLEDRVNETSFRTEEVYIQAVSSQPQVLAADKRSESAEVGVSIAKGALYPTINVFGSLNTNYSSLGRTLTGLQTVTSVQDLKLNGVPVSLEFQNQVPVFESNPYTSQLRDNFGQSVGISMQVPIFNNSRSRINIERAELGLLNNQAANLQVRQQLKAAVQRAIADLKSASKSLDAANQTLSAADIALDNARKRFEIGAINNFEFTTARNNFDRATADYTRARYQYLFNLKIVEFYQGKGLTLN